MSALSPTLLTDLPATVADTISTLLPALAVCETRHGRFTLEEVKTVGKKAPAVYVSILGARPGVVFAGPAHSADLDMAAYVLTKDALGLSRDEAAGNICLSLLSEIPERSWGLDPVGPAQRVGMQGLITRAVRDVGVSLWAVTWVQPIMTTGWDEGAPLPLELYLGRSPEIGAAHVDAYREIGGES